MVMEEKYQNFHLEYTSSYLDTRIIIQMQKITKKSHKRHLQRKDIRHCFKLMNPKQRQKKHIMG